MPLTQPQIPPIHPPTLQILKTPLTPLVPQARKHHPLLKTPLIPQAKKPHPLLKTQLILPQPNPMLQFHPPSPTHPTPK